MSTAMTESRTFQFRWTRARGHRFLVVAWMAALVPTIDAFQIHSRPLSSAASPTHKLPWRSDLTTTPKRLSRLGKTAPNIRFQRDSLVFMQLKPETTTVRNTLDDVLSDARSTSFSAAMSFCGAALGPCLDNYHSAFGVLAYDNPIKLMWSGDTLLTTAVWVPPLFGLAGFLIGWLYITLDAVLGTSSEVKQPTGPKILYSIAFFTFQYWLSGYLADAGYSGAPLFGILSVFAALGFVVFDNTLAGFITSVATGVGGPLIEMGLISFLAKGSGYHYTAPDFLDLIPLWICPVYFLGGPAVGNLARGIWVSASADAAEANKDLEPCMVCRDTRAVPCPNCDGVGSYVTYNRNVKCTSCSGRGFVICRSCFDRYGDDPWNIDKIRDMMDADEVQAQVEKEKRRKFLL